MEIEELSIIVVIKNRTSFKVHVGNEIITLNLFQNNLNNLFQTISKTDRWELVVVDFDSNDVNMENFLESTFNTYNKPNFKYKLYTIKNEKFCKGKGLNIGAKIAKYDTLFYLDADMLITDRVIFHYGYTFTKQGKAYFPVCMSYHGPQHSRFTPRPTGTGNVFITKKLLKLCKWKEKNKWGLEDTIFYNFYESKKLAIRNNVNRTFFHQWHPNSLSWKNRYYK